MLHGDCRSCEECALHRPINSLSYEVENITFWNDYSFSIAVILIGYVTGSFVRLQGTSERRGSEGGVISHVICRPGRQGGCHGDTGTNLMQLTVTETL